MLNVSNKSGNSKIRITSCFKQRQYEADAFGNACDMGDGNNEPASRKHLRTKVTPDFNLRYIINGGNLGSESK